MTGERPTDAALEAWIRVHQGPSAGQQFTTRTYPIVIGRGQDCDIRLEDNPQRPTISRQHARIVLESGRLKIEDLSTNGTWVASHQLSRGETVVLAAGQPVWLGYETLVTIDYKPTGEMLVATSHPAAARPDSGPPNESSRRPPMVPTLPLMPPPAEVPGPRRSLVLRTLGRFVVEVDDRSIPEASWQSRRAIVLVAYLADHAPQGVSSDRLVETLWPDERGTRQAVQTAASRVRKALRSMDESLPDPLRFTNNQYGLSDDYRITYDAHMLEAGSKIARRLWSDGQDTAGVEHTLTRALENYRGTFLDGGTEDWVVRRRASLEQVHGVCTIALANLRERRSDPHGALELYRALLARDASAEGAHEGLIRCLAALGRRDEALRQFQVSAAELKRLLGVGTGRGLIELREALVGGAESPLPEPFL